MAGPRLYRFYNYEQKQYLPAPVAGWNPDAPPALLPETEAAALDNFLIRPGKIACRGGFQVWADLSAVAPLNIVGVHPHLGDTQIIISRKSPSATAFIDPWNAPIIRPPVAASIALANLTTQWAAGGTTLTTVVAASGGTVPGPRGITFDGLRYYISYSTSGVPVHDTSGTYFAQTTSLCTQAGASFTELTLAPHGAVDLKGYQSRIWLLSGIDTPGAVATFDPLKLFFTVPGAAGVGALTADWRDPVSGLTNVIRMDGDSLDPGIGLATVRNALVVFRYASVWSVRGSSTASYLLVPVSREVGCIDARSIIECDRGAYFLSTKGLMLTDGISVKNVSGTVMQTLQNAIGVYQAGVLASVGGYATCARASDGSIIVSIGVNSVTGGAPDGHIQPVWCGLYNPDTGTWVRLTSPIWAADGTIITPGNNYPGWVTTPADRRLLTVGDKYITQLEAPAVTTFSALVAGPQTAAAAANDATVGVTAWTNPTNAEVADGAVADVSAVATSATKFAGAGADDSSVGTLAWSSAGNITATDSVDAQSAAGPGTTHYLKSSSHGFAVPSTAVIVGITAAVVNTTGSFNIATDSSIKLAKAGTPTGTNKSTGASWGGMGRTTLTYGSSTDLWGTTWSPADINAAGFGLAVSGLIPAGANGFIDSITITVYYVDPGSTQYLKATGYGFAIPTNASVTGIQVSVRRQDTANTGAANDLSVRLYKAGTLTGSDKASATAWPASLTTATYGGAGDLWGASWAASDINNANFGAAVAGGVKSGVAAAPHWAVDAITVTVYYTVPSATGGQSFVQSAGLYDKMANGTFQPIPATWKTRFATLVNPNRKGSQAKRIVMDYTFQGSGFLASAGWTVTPADAGGTSYSSVTVPLSASGGSSSVTGGGALPSPGIQRFTQEMVNEMQDLTFTVSWTDTTRATAPSNVVPEIYGVGVEFQQTRDSVTGG